MNESVYFLDLTKLESIKGALKLILQDVKQGFINTNTPLPWVVGLAGLVGSH